MCAAFVSLSTVLTAIHFLENSASSSQLISPKGLQILRVTASPKGYLCKLGVLQFLQHTVSADGTGTVFVPEHSSVLQYVELHFLLMYSLYDFFFY